MEHDLVINPFGAAVGEMVDAAVAAEEAGFDGVWVTDHFSGDVVGKPWSRDPFVCLGAIAVTTDRIRLGVLVANIANRHPAALASAISSVQSLAPGRVTLGIGSGAAPGSRFAVEHEAIGRTLGSADDRRRALEAHIGALRAIWRGDDRGGAGGARFDGLRAVTDGSPAPPIVVGASAWPTIEVALAMADGVNVRRSRRLPEVLARLVAARPDGFEVSVLDEVDPDHPFGADEADLVASGVDRRITTMSTPFDLAAIARVGAMLVDRR